MPSSSLHLLEVGVLCVVVNVDTSTSVDDNRSSRVGLIVVLTVPFSSLIILTITALACFIRQRDHVRRRQRYSASSSMNKCNSTVVVFNDKVKSLL